MPGTSNAQVFDHLDFETEFAASGPAGSVQARKAISATPPQSGRHQTALQQHRRVSYESFYRDLSGAAERLGLVGAFAAIRPSGGMP
jgi:hypothetical protein